MKIKNSLMIALLLVVPVLASSKPKVEYKLNDGECGNGASWWVVQRYIDGQLADSWGLDCQGNEWYRHTPSIVSSDPTGGETPTHTGIGENGRDWYAVLHFSPEGELIWAGGRDANGIYWVMDGPPASTGGGTVGLD